MPVVDTQRKYLSDVLAGANPSDNTNAMNFNYASATVTHAGELEPIGIPVVWDTSAATFVVYQDSSAAEIGLGITAGDSPLPGKGVVAILVGSAFGLGFNSADVDYTAGVAATVIHRGANNAGIKKAGIDYTTGATSAGNQTAFEAQLEVQGVMVIETAEVVTPTFTS